MAAPVGHIVCAIALLNSGVGSNIADKNGFFLGTNFPDIRYISDVSRANTHKTQQEGLDYVLKAETSFEAGRRFHVLVDREREKHMLEKDAYRFVKNGPLKTQMLKIVEDHILFDRLKDQFDAREVFKDIYDEEREFNVKDQTIDTWHRLLITYLDQSSWFNIVRYFRTLNEFQKAYGLPNDFFSNVWQRIRTIGFFVYAYFQVEKLSRDKNLREIILDFYENKINEIIKAHSLDKELKTVRLPSANPSVSPKLILVSALLE